MSGLDIDHLRGHVVLPVLNALGLWSPSAEDLVVGTAVQESHLRWLVQLGRGPALGLWQMEPATFADIRDNYLKHRVALYAQVEMFRAAGLSDAMNLKANLYYGAALCRIHYLRVPEALPAHGDLDGYASYWKRYYNTERGMGTVAEFVRNYRTAHALNID